ncbi:hypothetical protein [Rhodococcus sp. A5(2022)]|uniref:hypothetical protein n=1 Tax=Rhodococcus sp. A5(2022) TaxID=3003588 RepID=UPI0022A8C90F|nr:hypothetical protein [Rhodococcus sp. A5(2022)]MCZ1070810.1 hypothetical protein [Rhodococcus sp. A5(2022)]
MPPKRRGALAIAAASGDRLKALEALRDRLAREIEACESSRDVAALSRQLTDVLKQIEDLAPPAEEERSPLDELAQRRTRVTEPPRRPRTQVGK